MISIEEAIKILEQAKARGWNTTLPTDQSIVALAQSFIAQYRGPDWEKEDLPTPADIRGIWPGFRIKERKQLRALEK